MEPSASPEVTFLEPTLERATLIWWALLWRGVLLGFASGAIVGFIEGVIGALVGVPGTAVRYVAIVSGFAVGVPVGIYVVRSILKKEFREFSIRLVAKSDRPSQAAKG